MPPILQNTTFFSLPLENNATSRTLIKLNNIMLNKTNTLKLDNQQKETRDKDTLETHSLHTQKFYKNTEL